MTVTSCSTLRRKRKPKKYKAIKGSALRNLMFKAQHKIQTPVRDFYMKCFSGSSELKHIL